MNLDNLKEKFKKEIEDLNLKLYDLEYVKESSKNILRVTIDSKDGITIDDCENVSHRISDLLDVLDPIDEEYYLEVTSAGAEKELRNIEEMKDSIGKYVYIETFDQKYYGDLVGVSDGMVTIKIKNKNIDVSLIEVKLIRLSVKF